MPIAAWDLHTTPIPTHAPRSLRWPSDRTPTYFGSPCEIFHHRTPGTNQGVFIFEVQSPARFVFQYTLDPEDEHLSPSELRELMMDMVYIN